MKQLVLTICLLVVVLFGVSGCFEDLTCFAERQSLGPHGELHSVIGGKVTLAEF